MITVEWGGRLGNRMLQYAGAWVMSKYTRIELFPKKPDITQMAHTYGNFDEYFGIQPVSGLTMSFPLTEGDRVINIDDQWIKDKYKNFNQVPPAHYNIVESMQCPEFLNHYFNEIKNVYIPKKPVEEKEGVLVHCRLGDIPVERSGPLSYYRNALKNIQGKGGYLITDPMSKDHDLVKTLLNEYNLKLYMASPVEQLNFSRGFKELVVCTGTFGWWMGAFNAGSKVFYYDVPREYAWHASIFRVSNWVAVS